VFLFLTLNCNESYCLRYKQDTLQLTARNYVMLSEYECVKLLAAVAVVVAAGGDVM
jgi:hypothetical protein